MQDILNHISEQTSEVSRVGGVWPHPATPPPSTVSNAALAAVLQPEVDIYLQRLHRTPGSRLAPTSAGRPPRHSAAAPPLDPPPAAAAGSETLHSPASDGSVDVESLQAFSPREGGSEGGEGGGWEPVDDGTAAPAAQQAPMPPLSNLPPLPQSRGSSSMASSSQVSPILTSRGGQVDAVPSIASVPVGVTMAAAVRKQLPSDVQSFLAEARGWSDAGKPVKGGSDQELTGPLDSASEGEQSSEEATPSIEEEHGFNSEQQRGFDDRSGSEGSRHRRQPSDASAGLVSEPPLSPVSRLLSDSTYPAVNSTRSRAGGSSAWHGSDDTPSPSSEEHSEEHSSDAEAGDGTGTPHSGQAAEKAPPLTPPAAGR